MKNKPTHIAIIPDGNRRWARKRKLPIGTGHNEGAKSLEKIIEKAHNLDIKYLTVWGSSLSNISNRSEKEVNTLMGIFEKYFKKIASAKETHQNEVRVRVLGRWEELFSSGAKKSINEAIEKTRNYSRNNLTFLMAYNGTDEMVNAVKTICQKHKNKQNFKITPVVLKDNLWTHDLPPVDLVIRTGGEPHWSAGFMMFDVSEARLCFTETLWPSFSPQEFEKTINNYSQIERRFGK